MWPLGVGFEAEVFDHDAGLGQGPKLLAVEAFVTEAGVERFDKAVLPRARGVMQMVLILVSASQRWSALIGSATGCSGARNDYSGWQETISQIRNVSRSHA